MTKNIVPLKGSFMLTAIVGFIISWIYVYPRSVRWGAAFILFFILMFISSMISMTYSPYEVDEALQIKPRKKIK